MDANGSRVLHEPILPEQVVEILRLSGMKASNPIIEYTANDGTIKSGQCSWSQFGQMPRALEIYQRDGGESLNPEVKPMIVLFYKLGKQAWTHW